MNKYRLLETKIVDGTGKESFKYSIQKRWFFFWVPAILITHYYTYKERALLIGRNYTYRSKECAIKVLDHLNNPYKENYKGHNIIRVLDDDFTQIFIDKSDFTAWDGSCCYRFDNSLDALKRSIDAIVKSKTRKIIA